MPSHDPSGPPPKPPGGLLLDERYKVLAVLGEGSMGRVFEGRHTTLNKPVAIKVLHHHLASDERSRKRMLREARAASMIHHPNVVEIIDFGETPRGSVFLVMELLEGRDLSEVLTDDGALWWPRAHAMLRQIASALSVAHESGIVHRDIKPANCMVRQVEADASTGVDAEEIVKLLDFGIAKVDESSSSLGGLTGTGEVLGTATYMAPELTMGTPAGVPTDVYSLGCMAYEMLTGAPPFLGDNPYDVLRCHLEDTPAPMREKAPLVPAAFEALVLRAIAKKPADRFPSMAALEAALEAIPMPAPGTSPSPNPGGAARPDIGPTGTEMYSPAAMGLNPSPKAGLTDVVHVGGVVPRAATPVQPVPSKSMPAGVIITVGLLVVGVLLAGLWLFIL